MKNIPSQQKLYQKFDPTTNWSHVQDTYLRVEESIKFLQEIQFS